MGAVLTVECSYSGCGGRRAHHERPYEARGQQHFEVPDGHPGPYYCSIECSVYAESEKRQNAITQDAIKQGFELVEKGSVDRLLDACRKARPNQVFGYRREAVLEEAVGLIEWLTMQIKLLEQMVME